MVIASNVSCHRWRHNKFPQGFFFSVLHRFKGNELSLLLKQSKENHQVVHVSVSRPLKANYCWRGLNISLLRWRPWTHRQEVPGSRPRSDAKVEVVTWKFSSETDGSSSVIFAVSFSEPPQERQTRQQQKSSSPDRPEVRFHLFQAAFGGKELGFLRSPLREAAQFWRNVWNSHWNGLKQIPRSNAA